MGLGVAGMPLWWGLPQMITFQHNCVQDCLLTSPGAGLVSQGEISFELQPRIAHPGS